MIFSEAMRSLKFDKVRAFFYWLTFMLTTMFILLFFSISTTIGENNTVTLITFLVIVICSIDIFFANNFFVKGKAKEMAVRLVCGATYTYLAAYLLIQTTLLLLLALPFGYLLTQGMFPVVNMFLNSAVSISADAFGKSALMIGYVIFWTVLLNLSFAYKSAASMMLNTNGTLINGSANVLYTGNAMKGFKKVFFTLLFVAPVFMMFSGTMPVASAVSFGMIGFAGFIGSTCVPFLDDKIRGRAASDPVRTAYLGFLRMDLRMLKANIVLYIVSSLFLFALGMESEAGTAEHVLVMMSFVMMSMLLALAVMFKYATVQAARDTHFTTMNHLGYTDDAAKVVIFREVFRLYGFIFMSGALYLVMMAVSSLQKGTFNSSDAMIAAAAFTVPLVICALLSIVYYQRSVFSAPRVK